MGFVGYPNVGKSSIINAVNNKKACVSGPVPGETKIWQYVSLTRNIFLIDCPGIVTSQKSYEDQLFMGIIRLEKLRDIQNYFCDYF